MFLIGAVILTIFFILLKIIFLTRASNYKTEDKLWHSSRKEGIESEVIVVDKMTVYTENKKNKYVLFIQLKSRKILEVDVTREVFDLTSAGDNGMVKELNERTYWIKKVS